jgi:acyl-ACP thioesterase
MIETKKYSVQRNLKTYQMDRCERLRPVMLMNELQAIADTHAEILEAGRKFCLENEVAWVVTHFLVDIMEMPTDKEPIEIITWPSKHDSLKAVRDFEIRGLDGRLMVRATSQWVMIDLKTRKPLRLSEKLPEWGMDNGRAWDRTFEKFEDFEATLCDNVRPRYDDVDVNQHINNAVYAAWATESLGSKFRDAHELRGLEINFKKEIGSDVDSVEICSAISDGISRHSIKTADTDHAFVVCRWK